LRPTHTSFGDNVFPRNSTFPAPDPFSKLDKVFADFFYSLRPCVRRLLDDRGPTRFAPEVVLVEGIDELVFDTPSKPDALVPKRRISLDDRRSSFGVIESVFTGSNASAADDRDRGW
jgi:hypothetical protein